MRTKSRRAGAPKRMPAPPPAAWLKWSTELPQETIVGLKIRAAQERRPMRVVLKAAIDAYVATEVA